MLHVVRGPKTWQEALAWAQEAIRGRRYWPDEHFEDRCAERSFTVMEAKQLILSAVNCVPYAEGIAKCGGTCWRISGLDSGGLPTGIGVEIYRDHLGKVVVMITVLDES